ncbi:MAG: DUF2723 domain-containing protein [Chitinophagaceae bacterium]|nr:DUF2723 domain-containing protein [Chitinophagaceae bacterium]
MNFRKVNNITGWAIFLFAMATYFLTREARGSLWDCGEFVASANKMQLPHPPGAPLFVLLGRFFIILFGDNSQTAASAVNFMSALASAATILFLFWSITHFARKMFVGVGEELDKSQLITTMGAGAVGALAYTFSDSFWFSAVEGEVYALSSFFTALVFWVMLKWEHADEKAANDLHARARSDRWIVLFFFMMGLSIGVHLLNLLCIPAVVMIYYYRRYKVTTWGGILAFVIGCVITGLVQVGVIQYSMKAAGIFDVYFVNKMGMPFFSGFAIYFLLLAALVAWALRFNEKNISQGKLITWFTLFLVLSALPFIYMAGVGFRILPILLLTIAAALAGYYFKPAALKILKLSLWCYVFMLLGYFMYFTTMIRSNANPSVDMNNVDNPINLVYYLSREQYGEAPLLYGPHFAADYDYGSDGYVKLEEGEMKYVRGKDKYIEIGREKKPKYASKDMQLFPRIWDGSNDQYHADTYIEWLGLDEYPDDIDPDRLIEFPKGSGQRVRVPGISENLNWFFGYQMSFMYWRYFMWNFAGKQNDIQGYGNKRDGNWISGISMIDDRRLGDQSMLPDSIKKNKAHNTLFMLPFIIGILGCAYQFVRNKRDWVVNFLLFFFTGVAVVLYLNQPGNQPRERDYAYVGSFYAFAIWIGLAVVALVKMAREKEQKANFQQTLYYGSGLAFLVTLMSCFPGNGKDAVLVGAVVAAMYAAVTAGITLLLRTLTSGGKNATAAGLGATVFCLIVPLLMAQQVWDDHDRSEKTTAPDIAKNYLESCAPNAVIFTFGDNDTYPLWYAQEVEGVRKDIRVINNSLLGIDWYINQLRYKVNDADSLDVLWTPEQIEGHNREFLRFNQRGDASTYYDLYDVMKNVVGKVTLDRETGRDVGPKNFPVAKFKVPVNVEEARKNGLYNAGDSAMAEMPFEIPQNKLSGGLVRSDFIILNIIASNARNGWKRPIYFTSPSAGLGIEPYLRKDGMSFRLVPVIPKSPQQGWVVDQALRQARMGGTNIRDNNTDFMYNNLMTKFEFGGANKKGVYFDEENRRHILSLRAIFAEAAGNMADAGKKDEALKLINRVEENILPENLPYAMTSRYNGHNQTGLVYLEACYKAGKTELADKIRKELRTDLEQQQRYYKYIEAEHPEFFGAYIRSEAPINEIMLAVLGEIEKRYTQPAKPQQGVEGGQQIQNPAKPDTGKGGKQP